MPDAGGSDVVQPQCHDGMDNDGDGLVDYPNDPGCTAPNQDSETDDCPSGSGCPACANGIDDDMNGKTDYPDDFGCTSAADNDEYTENPHACGESVVIDQLPPDGHATGTLTSGTSNLMGACGGPGTEHVYELRILHPKVVVATTAMGGTTADTVLYIRSEMCTDASMEIACNDDVTTGNPNSTVTASITQPGTYYLVVDTKSSNGGMYDLHVQFLTGEGDACTSTDDCGPGLICRVPLNGTDKVCSPHVCNDGVDDDTDGANDYPDDPGCASPDDDDETDDCPSGPNCPQCGNGVDDDNDGNTDYPADTQCMAASSTSESCHSTEGVTEITTGTTSGDTTGATNDVESACVWEQGAPDLTYRLVLPALSTFSASVDAGFNWYPDVELLDSTCGGTELACEYEDLTQTNVAAGTYYLVVDGDESDSAGAFTLTVSGTIQPNESCESPLAQSGALTCSAGYTCKGTMGSRTCQPAACNDGINNDSDTVTDYPDDPGCTSPADDDETDDCPNGPNCPACANGIDDDSDGDIDYPADAACLAASSATESCASQEGVTELTTATTTGDTSTAADDVEASCGFDTGSPDLTYRLDLPSLSSFTVDFEEDDFWYGEVELLDSTCGGTDLACEYSEIANTNMAAGTYYLVVDGDDEFEYGPFTLSVHGTIAAGGSCESPLAQSGALSCPTGYGCIGTAGSRTCQPAQCSDGIDNDADGTVDYPYDPGCSSPTDNDETDPATPPVCSNAMDDDTDGQMDWPADYGCSSAGGTSEQFCTGEMDPTSLITTKTTTGDTSAMTNDFQPLLCYYGTGSQAADAVYALQLPVPVASLQIDTIGTQFDTFVSLRDTQCGTELACDDSNGDATYDTSKLTLTNVLPGGYAVIVDAYQSASGPFTLNVHGTVATGTACESPLFTGGANAVLSCPNGTTCGGTPKTCH